MFWDVLWKCRGKLMGIVGKSSENHKNPWERYEKSTLDKY